jgi:outer membrane protein OmpA-like peptidoglycan-associated protein
MARIIATLLAFCCLLSSAPAWADATTRLGLTLKNTVSGKAMPAVVIQPGEVVKSITVSLKRNDGKTQKLSAFNVQPNVTKELNIRQEAGRFTYDSHFTVKWASGEPSEFDMRFTMTRVKRLTLKIVPEDVDLDARSMTFTISNPAKYAELSIIGQSGKPLKTIKKDYNAAQGGTRLNLKWKDPGGDILYMDLKVYDVAGFWKGVRLTPFTISVPHDDVEFGFGKWSIRKSEAPKLKETMKHLREALEKHGTLLTLKLYVAGYTDTVGSPSANTRLSNNRARSIARWFRKHGLKIPIFYQGFGEKVLAKSTPDETPEPANRRALYILSSQMPAKGGQVPGDKWNPI